MAKGKGNRNDADAKLVDAALAGDEAAAATIRSTETTRKLEQILVGRGASSTEAKDIVADVWGDCFDSREGRTPLLQRFQGKGNLTAFLSRTAINRLIDFKRRQRFRGELPRHGGRDDEGSQPADAFDQLPGASDEPAGEDALVDILRTALLATFSKCDPEELLILRLVGACGIGQERVARMWGWSQSKISRSIAALKEHIESETLKEVRRVDPWLELEWEDFVRLCRSSSSFYRWDEGGNDRSNA